MLLMGAGVMLRSLRRRCAASTPASIRSNVLTLRVTLPETRYTTPAQISAFFDDGAAAHPRASGRPGGRRRSTICRSRAGRCSRSSSKGTPSCCRAISRPSRCARSRRATFATMRDSAAAGPRRRGRRRRGHARQPRRREAAVGRRRSDRPARHAAAPVEDGRRSEVIGIVGDVKQGRALRAAGRRRSTSTRASATWSSLSLVAADVGAAAVARAGGRRRRARDRSGAAGRRRPHDGRRARRDADVAALQRAAARRCSRRSRWRSRRSGSTASCRTSCAAAAARSASGRRSARARPTWSGWSSSKA